MERTYIKETIVNIGKEVILFGWVDTIRDHGKLTFIDLRDASGKVQCVGSDILKDLTPESVIRVIGEVCERPENMVNDEMETGKIEIKVKEYEVLNKSKELPIPIDGDGLDINEEKRLEYRYLDLRRERMRKNLILRSKFVQELRNYLYGKNFIEVETPLLTKSTKEGARDFIIPSRYHPGKFYALPQAPQQYKQLLMSSGVEKYFQLAKCIRDEDLRSDRGYEFTQLDLEMSFVEKEDIMELIEDLVKGAVKGVGGKLKDKEFPVITYEEAHKKYGDDKFDLRTEKEKEDGILSFAWVVDFPFFKKVDKKDAVERADGKSGYTFTHNPFSNPIPEDIEKHKEGKDVEGITTQQYDLVCNGYEVGGGSIRAHDPEVLKATFKIMGYSDDEIEESIGHMLEAFRIGTPPHGGIALGIDRLVMILAGETSIKEVIPFPMTSSGKTAVMDAPSEPSPEQLEELHLKVTE
ncbi:amino acid--tRNA ligase-related protein [Patescibacteria group bacterium]